jgi:uncharacterized protein YjiS (DUF1127 family)
MMGWRRWFGEGFAEEGNMSITEFRPGAGFAPRVMIRSRGMETGFLATLVAAVQLWRRRARDRAELARMGVLALQDLGVPDPNLAWQEAKRPFWRDAQGAWRAAVMARSSC